MKSRWSMTALLVGGILGLLPLASVSAAPTDNAWTDNSWETDAWEADNAWVQTDSAPADDVQAMEELINEEMLGLMPAPVPGLDGGDELDQYSEVAWPDECDIWVGRGWPYPDCIIGEGEFWVQDQDCVDCIVIGNAVIVEPVLPEADLDLGREFLWMLFYEPWDLIWLL